MIDLNGAWSMAYSREGKEFKSSSEIKGAKLLTANVPGNFELDLQKAGIIPEPFYGMNMKENYKLEDRHIYYFRSFKTENISGTEAFLVFEGLDTFAEVYLNGTHLASCGNMFIEHRIPLDGLLKSGENELFIHIRPAVTEAAKYECSNFVSSGHGLPHNESVYVRKAPHMYGWDIMPRAVSAGIWRSVSIQFLPKERIENLYLETISLSPDRQDARLRLNYSTTLKPSALDTFEISIEGSSGDASFSIARTVHFPKSGQIFFNVKNPRPWWPRGAGLPELYNVKVTLKKNNFTIDERLFRFGIRSVELVRTSSTSSTGDGEFLFKINHEKIFMKGSNWVPLDAFHSRDAERLEKAFGMVTDLECNILRCWGGNVYESDRFYELCDENGICVWQDFAMACYIYPQDECFRKSMADEARTVIRRLRQHPCLILWAGDNECDSAYEYAGLGDPNLNVITRGVLPAVLRDEDHLRPYLPSSPFTDSKAYSEGVSRQDAGGRFLPENHLWGPRDSFKSSFYQNAACHFVSEIGYHGCPSPESIRKFISPDKVWPWRDNEEWILHSSCPMPGFFGLGDTSYDGYRVELMAKQIKELFGTVPENLEDFAFASQAVQAEAKKFFIEMFRSAKWRRTGILWWNLLDGWPQFSDAVVDYYFEKKMAYDYIKRAQRHLCLIFREPKNWHQELTACNDLRKDVSVKYKVRDIDSGEILLSGEKNIAASAVSSLGRIPFSMGDKRFYIIQWKDETGAGYSHYLAGNPPFDMEQYRKWFNKFNETRLKPDWEQYV